MRSLAQVGNRLGTSGAPASGALTPQARSRSCRETLDPFHSIPATAGPTAGGFAEFPPVRPLRVVVTRLSGLRFQRALRTAELVDMLFYIARMGIRWRAQLEHWASECHLGVALTWRGKNRSCSVRGAVFAKPRHTGNFRWPGWPLGGSAPPDPSFTRESTL